MAILLQNKKVQLILWTIFFWFVSWGPFLPGVDIGIISLFPLRIVLICWFVIYLASHPFSKKLHILEYRAALLLGFFLLWGICTVFFTYDKSDAISALIIYGSNFLVFWMCETLVDSRETLKIVSFAIFINVLVMCGIAIYETLTNNFVIPTDYRFLYRHHNIFDMQTPKAMFVNPNNFAIYLILFMPICFIFSHGRNMSRIINSIIFVFLSFIVLISGCRTGVVCAILIACYFLIINVYYSSKFYRFLSITFLIIVLFVLLSYFAYISTNIILEHDSLENEDRLPLWKDYLMITSDNYFMGCGIGNATTIHMAEYNDSLPPHSLFLEILCELGLVGLMAFCAFLNLCIPTYKMIKEDELAKYLFVIFPLLLVGSLCPATMQQSYYLWAILGICMAYKTKLV